MKILTDLRFYAVITTLLLCISAGLGSLPSYGNIYGSPYFLLLWLLFSIVMVICSVKVVCGGRSLLYKAGVTAAHIGVLLILAGAYCNIRVGFDGVIYLPEGVPQSLFIQENEKDKELGFEVRCDDFNTEYYENIPRAKSYTTRLSILDGDRTVIATVDVNQPFQYKGITFFQYDYGIDPSREISFSYSIKTGNRTEDVHTELDEKAEVDGKSVRVIDFSPALGVRPDGSFYSYNTEQLLNPAALFEISSETGTFRQWVLKNPSENRMKLGDTVVVFKDFHGIEYSVLGVSKSPYNFLFYIGFICLAFGFGMIYLPGWRK